MLFQGAMIMYGLVLIMYLHSVTCTLLSYGIGSVVSNGFSAY